jgi:hypothetical protein
MRIKKVNKNQIQYKQILNTSKKKKKKKKGQHKQPKNKNTPNETESIDRTHLEHDSSVLSHQAQVGVAALHNRLLVLDVQLDVVVHSLIYT